ncbi:Uncharacterised protein [Vibrio cholerae]|nr:Uncharacterised protein [Vibrio cholerae]
MLGTHKYQHLLPIPLFDQFHQHVRFLFHISRINALLNGSCR